MSCSPEVALYASCGITEITLRLTVLLLLVPAAPDALRLPATTKVSPGLISRLDHWEFKCDAFSIGVCEIEELRKVILRREQFVL